MNITMNELLIKKINFAGGETSGTVAENPVPAQEPQQGMNALMFQGLKNLMSNPMLAKEVGVEGEDKGEASDAKSYVAPYSTNIAFGNKSKIAKTALAGLAVVAAGATVTSCKETPAEMYQYQENNMDVGLLMSLMDEIKGMRQDMNNNNAEQLKKLQTMTDLLNQSVLILQSMQQTQTDEASANKTFRQTILSRMDDIIDIMVERGISEDEARKIINAKLDALISGQLTIIDFMTWLNEYAKNIAEDVSAIRNNLETCTANMENYAKQVINNQGATFDLLYENFAGFNGQLNKLIEGQEEQTTRLEQATDKLGEKVDDNFAWIAQQMNMSTAALRAEIIRLGLSTNCTLQQLLAAQKAELAVNKEILAKVTDISNRFAKGELDAKAFANAVMKLLGEINTGVQSIATAVNGMAETVNKLYASFKDYKQQSLAALGGIYMNGVINNMKLDEANRLAKLELNEIKSLRAELKTLDPAQLKEIITEAVKEGSQDLKAVIEAKGIDYDKLNAMFKMLGKDITSAVNMSTEELKALIEKFDNDVMGAEEAQTEKITAILDAIKGIDVSSNPQLAAAIQTLVNAVNNGAKDITAELNKVEELLGTVNDKLDGLQKSLDDLLSEVRSINIKLTLFNTYWNRLFDELGDIKALIEKMGPSPSDADIASFKAQLAQIIANQEKANKYAGQAEEDRATIIAKLNQYKDIDYDRLEEMLGERDKQYFIKLANLLGVDPNNFESIGDLIKALDAKMQYIKDSEAKIDKIIEILENWDKCGCKGSNEGIIQELNDLMNGGNGN